MQVQITGASEAKRSAASSQYKNNEVIWVNNIEETIVGRDFKFEIQLYVYLFYCKIVEELRAKRRKA